MRLFNLLSLTALTTTLAIAGCQSTHESGVKSNLRTQWTEVAADTKATTEAAQAVLEGEGLKDVKAKSTNVDGTASGKMADGTKVAVTVQKKTEAISQVSVNVGKLGDPKLGAEIAKKIRVRVAEDMPAH